jgi:hypothetical protein
VLQEKGRSELVAAGDEDCYSLLGRTGRTKKTGRTAVEKDMPTVKEDTCNMRRRQRQPVRKYRANMKR